MNRHAYRALIQSLEPYAAQYPGRYRLQVVALAVLGYGYLLGLAALIIGGAALTLHGLGRLGLPVSWPVAAVVLGVCVLIVARALWVRWPEPDGLLVGPEVAAPLHAWLAALRREGRAPRIHEVLVTPDLNAAIVQVPRLGPFGWCRNYLQVGLPLMEVLTVDEFHAVVAHECGHMVGGHGHVAAWIHRLRTTWDRWLDRCAEGTRLDARLLAPFFGWYAPFFSAYSFVWARANEIDADRHAARVAGPDAAGRALLRVALAVRTADTRFWPTFLRQSAKLADPPADAITQFARALAFPPSPEDIARWTTAVLLVKTDDDDTHPSLDERFAALGWDPDGGRALFERGAVSAAAWCLGDAGDALRATIDAGWREGQRPEWRARHDMAQSARVRLAEIDADLSGTLELAWERVSHLVQLEGARAAVAQAEAVLAEAPDHARARYFLGCVRLDEQDDSGIALVEGATRLDEDLALVGYEVLFSYCWSRGQLGRAERYRQLRDERQELLSRAEHERRAIDASATYLPHGLSPLSLHTVRAALERCRNLGEAYLVRRDVQTCPEWPCYVLAVASRGRLVDAQSAHDRDVLEAALRSSGWPQGTYVFEWSDLPKRVRRLIANVPGAKVF